MDGVADYAGAGVQVESLDKIDKYIELRRFMPRPTMWRFSMSLLNSCSYVGIRMVFLFCFSICHLTIFADESSV